MTPDRQAAMITCLTGQETGLPRPDSIGQKFTPDGSVLPFSGNTFLCHVDPTSAAHRALCAAQDKLRAGSPAGAFTYLPPASLHMTVFEGVCDAYRSSPDWVKDLPLTLPVAEVTSQFSGRIKDVTLPDHFSITPVEMFCGLGLNVAGASVTDAAALQTSRNALRQATGIHRADFGAYQFHITLAYLLRWLSPPEAEAMVARSNQVLDMLQHDAGAISLGPVEFCQFNDMHAFTPVAA